MDNIHILKSVIKILYRELISNYSLKNDIDDYLEQIIYVLKYNNPWHLLKSNLHYSTYFKFYKRLVYKNIFKLAYHIINFLYIKNNYNDNINFFIDATNIRNMNGSDKLGINVKDKCKKGNKISVIVYINGIPISIKIVEANKHDIKILYPNINKIKNVKFKNVNLIADKGYINKNNKKMLNIEHINLIY